MKEHAFAERGMKDGDGNPIVASEQPMDEKEFSEFRKQRVEAKLEKIQPVRGEPELMKKVTWQGFGQMPDGWVWIKLQNGVFNRGQARGTQDGLLVVKLDSGESHCVQSYWID